MLISFHANLRKRVLVKDMMIGSFHRHSSFAGLNDEDLNQVFYDAEVMPCFSLKFQCQILVFKYFWVSDLSY